MMFDLPIDFNSQSQLFVKHVLALSILKKNCCGLE